MRPRRVRSMRQFAEDEFVIPDGDYQGTRFRPDVQPAHALWLDEIDSGRWREHYLLACQQSGKSVSGFLIPLLYHLFELRQTVICGIPLLDLRKDKWDMEILPAIEASRYRDLIPKIGAGSKGGVAALMKFSHGPALRFMTGGGNDKTRSSFTAPVLITTETEGFGSVSVSSGESVTPLDQLRGRTSFYGSRARIYHECTVESEHGIMWTGHQTGSGGQVVFPCPGCGAGIHPEREHLIGWHDLETEIRAKQAARWSCPACGILFDESQRKQALRSARIIHRGQHFINGEVHGANPETEVLSVRYGASANAFSEAGMIGVAEWQIKYQMETEAGESKSRALDQWTFATPIKETAIVVDPLDIQRLLMRQGKTQRGFCPADTELLTAGCDVRKTQLHWYVIAWRRDGGPRVVDFGIERVPSSDMPIGDAIQVAGETVQEYFQAGFPVEGSEDVLSVAQTLVDAGYQTDDVESLCAKDSTWLPAMGFGTGMLRDKKYNKPRNVRSARIIGNGWHVAEVRGRMLVELDANKQKSALHRALSVPDHESPHALLFCSVHQQDLRDMVYELTAEEQRDRHKPGVGLVTEWKPIRKRNHFLDAAYQAYAAKTIHEELVKLIEAEQAAQQPDEIEWQPSFSGPGGGIFG
jgi:phage terminase large subunit GpA-like protein